MGFPTSKVFVALSTLTLLVVLSVVQPAHSLLCDKGRTYHDHKQQRCVNCTNCELSNLMVLRPCEVHRDTICAPLSKLWDTLRPDVRMRHERHHFRSREQRVHHESTTTITPLGSSVDDELSDIVVATSTEAPFSSVEALVWDWQAIALTFAVFSCILFFLVVTLYSLHQAKQWRRLKENFEADVEELSARLSLMAAASSEKGEILEPSFGPIHDSNYLNNRCMYLEQLLHVRKDHNKLGAETTGNVYIEEANSSSSSSSAANSCNNGKT